MKSSSKFIHLRNYTQYSLSKGALKITDLVQKCVDEKIPAVGISDFNNLFGCMEFSLECKSKGVQPIIGCNLFLSDNNFLDGYILLIAKNENGFKNLSNLVSISFLENSENINPYINFENLERFSNDLVCIAGGKFGFITKNFFSGNKLQSNLAIEMFSEIFKDNFFLEIQKKESKKDQYFNYLIKQSNIMKIPLVATNENFFLERSFFDSHDALLSISQQKYLESEDRLKSDNNFCFKSEKEMLSEFSDLKDAVENTVLLAKKCNYFLEEKPAKLPKVELNSTDENVFLKKKSYDGLKSRIQDEISDGELDIYKKRLDYELDTITKMGYSSYFLIVSDFINWAKDNNIPVGPGRGSGAGSLVAWCLSITNLNPIKFGLLFERFLNPERVSLPDFDIDFCMDRRDDVIKYVQKKYGISNVAQIITFGSFQARAAIRDVGRVMQLPLYLVDDLCKMIPFNPAQQVSLKEFIKSDEKVKKIISNDSNIKKLFEISKNLEGLYRHASTHAAGIVISDQSLKNLVPLYKDPKSDVPVTQFSMKYVEKIGLIKFDFLGLKTLTVIQEAIENLKRRKIFIDIDNIPLDDKKTFELLRNGNTTGIFQLEGQGMRETLKNIIPDRFEDLIAVVSLYRPGPMDNIQTYINRKQNKESYYYIHNELKKILDETYGIMVYQEQVMLIAQKVAGFSLAKADLLRRAMGKKIKSEMIAQKSNFVEGCVKNGLTKKKASELFDEIEKFAGYGFNKSHAAAYAMIAYQTAFLKANFPLEFLCSLMNCDIGNFEKISSYCNEVKKFNFKMIKPDINDSSARFEVIYKDDYPIGINFGLSAIKNIGENSVIEIVKEREDNGKFTSLLNLLKRLNNSTLNKKIIEALIFSESLKSLEDNQNFLIQKMDEIISFNVNFHKNFIQNQNSLFNEDLDANFFDSSNFTNIEFSKKLEMEYDAFGFYLTEHPTKLYKTLFRDKKISNLSQLFDTSLDNSSNITKSVIALISEKKERTSRLGKKFCFLKLTDDSGELDTICFSEVLEGLDFELTEGKIVLVKLSLQNLKDSNRFIVVSLANIEKINNQRKKIEVLINSKSIDHLKFEKFFRHNKRGDCEILFYIHHDDQRIKIKSDHFFEINLDEISALRKITGIVDVIRTN